MPKKTITLRVDGCDDTTTVYLEVTEEQETFLREVAKQVTATSEYICQPRMRIKDTK